MEQLVMFGSIERDKDIFDPIAVDHFGKMSNRLEDRERTEPCPCRFITIRKDSRVDSRWD